MLLSSLLELAFGQFFFNHMRASVCVPVWDCSCYLIEEMTARASERYTDTDTHVINKELAEGQL